jgi:DNA-binding protein H-NS
MATSYKELQKQIAQLTAEAEKVREGEANQAISKVKDLISVYGLTAEQLGLVVPGKRGPKKKSAATKTTKSAPKYRDPATGKEWTGKGKRPNWIVSAGTNLEKFLIANMKTEAKVTVEPTSGAPAPAATAPVADKKVVAKKAPAKSAAAVKKTAEKKVVAKKPKVAGIRRKVTTPAVKTEKV